MIEEIDVKLEFYRECYTSFLTVLNMLQTETDETKEILMNGTTSEMLNLYNSTIPVMKEKLNEKQRHLETIYKNDLTFSEYIVVEKIK